MQVTAGKALVVGLMIAAVSAMACSGGSSSEEIADAPTSRAEPTTPPPLKPTEVSAAQLLSVAPDFTLPDATGTMVTLSELSSEQPVVLVFYRAFW